MEPLEIDLINGFTPKFGDSFQLFTGPTTGTFSSVTVSSPSGLLSVDASKLYSQGTITLVPEPASLSIIAGSAMLVVRSKRRRAR